MSEESDRWTKFACAALSRHDEQSTSHACSLADVMMQEYDRRYGDTALLLAGIRNCYVCDKLITGLYITSDGKDGEYKKFCKACVDEHNPSMISKDSSEEDSNVKACTCKQSAYSANYSANCPFVETYPQRQKPVSNYIHRLYMNHLAEPPRK